MFGITTNQATASRFATTVSAAALTAALAASPAAAQNQATVEQQGGSGNSTILEQVSDGSPGDNSASAVQRNTENSRIAVTQQSGNGNDVQASQTGQVENGEIDVLQNGGQGNRATARQRNTRFDAEATGNTITQRQSGEGNRAAGTQYNALNQSTIFQEQAGQGNRAVSIQNGGSGDEQAVGASATISQRGDNNRGKTVQVDSGWTAWITQNGNQNNALIKQTRNGGWYGNDGRAGITQTGSGATAKVFQDSLGWNTDATPKVFVNQGDDAFARVTQKNAVGGTVTVNQNTRRDANGDPVARVTQNGVDGSEVSLVQDGQSKATVTQAGTTGGTARVNQNGYGHNAAITQRGGTGNSATVRQGLVQ